MTRKISSKKIELVKEISENVSNASLTIFADYKGLKVNEITELRKKMRENDCKINVYKNTLVYRALTSLKIDTESTTFFSGPTAVVTSNNINVDPAKVAKIFVNYAKDKTVVKIKGGVFENTAIENNTVTVLAKLPSRAELIAQTIGTIKAPLTRLVMVLSNPINNLGYVVKAISEKK